MLKNTVKRVIPQRILDALLTCRYYASVVCTLRGYGEGLRPIQCIVCGKTLRFTAFGRPPRLGARCPSCGSLERHRLLVLLDGREQLFQGKSVLHFAPELPLQQRIKKVASRYLSADIEGWRADVQMNIEAIDEPSDTWDVVIASHVFEHVNDELAMSEIFRILKAGGKCISMTPVIEGWRSTYENPAITKPVDRLSHFGQQDHVRYYGQDFKERLQRAGFMVREFCALGNECVEYGLLRGEKVFIGSK
jgi:SAM-dependent methyltransferase